MYLQRLITGWAVLACFFISPDLFAQEGTPISLRNPSFEDFARPGSNTSPPPRGWYDCGKPNETAPDIHSSESDNFEVTKAAFDKNTYMGLVVRDNETWEAVSQRLPRALEQGKAYTMALHLARSETYISPGRTSGVETNFNKPIKIRIWGGNSYCQKAELLDETALIKHTNWKQYQFRFEPKKKHNYILIEAFWNTPVIMPYNGNILVDNATAIYEVPMNEPTPPIPSNDPPLVKILNPKRSGLKSEDNTFTIKARIENMESKSGVSLMVNGRSKNFSFDVAKGAFRAAIPLAEGENKIRIKATNPGGTGQDESLVVYSPKVVQNPTVPKPPVVVTPEPKENYVLTPELNKKPQSGKKIRLEKLYFQADSTRITEDAFPILDEFAQFLKSNPAVIIEVGGHTNNRCADIICQQLSEARAKAVASYLAKRGISSNRLKYKGYGKNEPVANNDTYYGRKKNQRVEIKIL